MIDMVEDNAAVELDKWGTSDLGVGSALTSGSPTRTSRDRDRLRDQAELTLKSEAPHIQAHRFLVHVSRCEVWWRCGVSWADRRPRPYAVS
jgi:hypothetical protein